MFKDSLFESDHELEANRKLLSIPAVLINGFVLIALILWPLVHPLTLPKQSLLTVLSAPAPPPAPAHLASSPPASSPSRASLLRLQIDAPSHIPKLSPQTEEASSTAPETGVSQMLSGGGDGNTLSDVVSGTGTRSTVVAAQPAHTTPTRVRLSGGVIAGTKLSGATPVYSAIARASGAEGTVVLQAVISKTGGIENLRVLSGPPLLVNSAIDAVRTWRYRPYLLNGEPVEVETTINVVFSMHE